MRLIVDIPSTLYRRLEAQATQEKCSVKDLILRAIKVELRLRSRKRTRRIVFPIIPSQRPGTLDIDNAKIFELIPFP
jgi:hypothetical protein